MLLYDLTSTYFEGEAEEVDKAQRGYSRDHRPDCKQIIIALVVTPEGFPLSYEVFAGNRADVTTLEEMLEAVERKHGRARRVWVFDRGIVSEENLQSCGGVEPVTWWARPARNSKLTSADCWRATGRKSLAKWRSNSLPRIRRPTCWPAAGRGRRKKARCVCGLCAA